MGDPIMDLSTLPRETDEEYVAPPGGPQRKQRRPAPSPEPVTDLDTLPKEDDPEYQLPQDTEAARRRIDERVWNIVKEEPDAEEHQAKIWASAYLSAKLDKDPQWTYKNFDYATEKYFGDRQLPQTAWEHIRDSFRRGEASLEMGLEGSRMMVQALRGEFDPESESWKKIQELRGEMPPPEEVESWVARQLGYTAEQIPRMLHGQRRGAELGLGAGLGAASAAALGGLPLVSGPQAVLGAPGYAASVGGAFTAAFGPAYKLGTLSNLAQGYAGSTFIEIMDMEDPEGERVDPQIAAAASAGAGILNAITELWTYRQIPGADRIVQTVSKKALENALINGAFKNAAANTLAKWGWGVGAGVINELVQESVQVGMVQVSDALDQGAVEGLWSRYEADEIRERMHQIMVQSAGSYGVLGLPGTAANIIAGPIGEARHRADVESAQQQSMRDAEVALEQLEQADPTALSPEMLENAEQLIADLERSEAEQEAQTQQVQEQATDPEQRPIWQMTREEWQQREETTIEEPGQAYEPEAAREVAPEGALETAPRAQMEAEEAAGIEAQQQAEQTEAVRTEAVRAEDVQARLQFAPEQQEASRRIQEIPSVIGEKPSQPVSDFDTIYQLAEEARPRFDEWITPIAEQYGAEVISRQQLKRRERAEQKIDEMQGPETVLDVDAKTLVFDKISGLQQALEEISQREDVARVKNRFAEPLTGGYRDVLANVRLPNGVVGEVQMSTQQMMEAKDSVGHVLYEVARELDSERMPAEASEQANTALDLIENTMTKVYDAAWEASLADTRFNASSLDIGEELNQISAALEPEPISSSLSENTRKAFVGLVERSMRTTEPSQSPQVSRAAATNLTPETIIEPIRRESNDIAHDPTGRYTEQRQETYGEVDPDAVHEEVLQQLDLFPPEETDELFRAASVLPGRRAPTVPRLGPAYESRVKGTWRKHRRVDFVGHQFSDPRELAELFSIYRHPRLEHLHLIYVDKDNRIIAHNALSSGLATRARAVEGRNWAETVYRVNERMRRLGADGYYLLHNHPSGRATPSMLDVDITASYAQRIPGLRGHIVIDHDTFTLLQPDPNNPQQVDSQENIVYEGGQPHVFDVIRANDPQKVAELGRQAMQAAEKDVLLVFDNTFNVVAWHPVSDVSRLSGETLSQIVKSYGGIRAAFVTDSRGTWDRIVDWNTQELANTEHDRLIDIVWPGTEGRPMSARRVGRMPLQMPDPEGARLRAGMRRGQPMSYLWEPEPGYQPGGGDSQYSAPPTYVAGREEQYGSNAEPQRDAHYEAVRKAVEQGVFVPDRVLEQYRFENWAQEEQDRRAMIRSEATQFDSVDEFVDFMTAMDPGKADEAYYREIYNQGNTTPQAAPTRAEMNQRFVENMSKAQVELWLGLMFQQNQHENANPTIRSGAIGVGRGKGRITDKHYARILAMIRKDPTAYREWFAQVFQDEDEIQQLITEQQRGDQDMMSELHEEVRKLNERLERKNQSAKANEAEIRQLNNYVRNLEDEMSRMGIDVRSLSRRSEGVGAVQQLGQQREQLQQRITELESRLESLKDTGAEAESRRLMLSDALRDAKREHRIIDQMHKHKLRSVDEAIKSAREEAALERRTALQELRARQAVRQRMNRMIRHVMRKPPATIAHSHAEQIRAIQSKLYTGWSARKERLVGLLRDYATAVPGDEVSQMLKLELEKRNIRSLSLEELTDIDRQITALENEGRMQRWLELLDERMLIEGAREEILQNVGRRKIEGKGTKEAKKALHAGVGGRVRVATLRPERMARLLDGDREGPVYQWLWRKTNEATNEMLRRTDERINPGIQRMQELGITGRRLGEQRTFQGHTLTVDEIMHLYIAMQNPESRDAVIFGNGIPEDVVTGLTATLSREEKQWAQWMTDSFSQEQYERVLEVLVKDENRGMPRVERYFPMLRQNIDYETINQQVADDIVGRTPYRKSYAQKGFTKSRQKISQRRQTPIRLGATKIWMEQTAKQEQYIASGILIKRLHRIFGNREVQEAIQARFGTEFNRWIEKYINDFANPDIYRGHEGLAHISRLLRRHAQVSYLAFNVVTMLKQTPSVAFYLADAGPWHLASSAAQMVRNPRAAWRFVRDRDPQVEHRSMMRSMEELKRMDRGAYERLIGGVGRAGMAPIKIFDGVAVTIGWKAVYDRAIRQGASEQEAIQAAQNATLKTQPAARAKDLAEIYRSHEGFNWFLMFTNQLNQIWNMVTYDIPVDVKQRQYGHALLLASSVALSGIAIGAASNREVPEDTADAAKKAGRYVADQLISSVPVVGGNIKSGMEGWWGTGVDPVPAASQLGRTVGTIADPEADWENRLNSTAYLLRDALVTMGIPSVAAARLHDTFYESRWFGDPEFDPWELFGGIEGMEE